MTQIAANFVRVHVIAVYGKRRFHLYIRMQCDLADAALALGSNSETISSQIERIMESRPRWHSLYLCVCTNLGKLSRVSVLKSWRILIRFDSYMQRDTQKFATHSLVRLVLSTCFSFRCLYICCWTWCRKRKKHPKRKVMRTIGHWNKFKDLQTPLGCFCFPIPQSEITKWLTALDTERQSESSSRVKKWPDKFLDWMPSWTGLKCAKRRWISRV